MAKRATQASADHHSREQIEACYRNPPEWMHRSILNTGGMGRFSSDHSVWQYAEQIWHAPLITGKPNTRGFGPHRRHSLLGRIVNALSNRTPIPARSRPERTIFPVTETSTVPQWLAGSFLIADTSSIISNRTRIPMGRHASFLKNAPADEMSCVTSFRAASSGSCGQSRAGTCRLYLSSLRFSVNANFPLCNRRRSPQADRGVSNFERRASPPPAPELHFIRWHLGLQCFGSGTEADGSVRVRAPPDL